MTDAYKAVQSIAFSSDSGKIAAGGKDSVVRIWNVADKKLVHTLGGRGWGHSKWVNGVAFSPDAKLIASVSTDQTLRFWDVETGTESATLHGHTKTVNAVAFTPDGRRAITAAVDKTIRSWDVAAANPALTVWRIDTFPPSLSDYVVGFTLDANPGIRNSLLAKIATAIKKADSGEDLAARAALGAFINDQRTHCGHRSLGNDPQPYRAALVHNDNDTASIVVRHLLDLTSEHN